MPNLWTHVIFGQKLAEDLGAADPLKGEQEAWFRLGTQGPDFLFFYQFWPWKNSRGIPKLGNAMHEESCGEVLADMVDYARQSGRASSTRSYVLGFLTHHILDRNMHPYIFYKSGFKKWDHQRFEVILDTIMVKEHLGLDTWRTPAWKQIYVGDGFTEELETMLEGLADNYFPKFKQPGEAIPWSGAYRDMVRAHQIFHDPYGLKRCLTLGAISPMVYKRKVAPLDYLNEEQREWKDPTDLSIAYTHSVRELWQQAMEDGRRVVGLAAKLMDEDGAGHTRGLEEEFREALGSVSYSSGKPCGSGLKIQYADPMI